MLTGFAYCVLNAQGLAPSLDSSNQVVPTFVKLFANPWIAGLIVAAALSVIMSTSASLMLSMSTSIVQDMLSEMLKLNVSGKKGVTYGRFAMLVITIISAAFALNPNSDILTMGAKTFGCFGAVFTPVILFDCAGDARRNRVHLIVCGVPWRLSF